MVRVTSGILASSAAGLLVGIGSIDIVSCQSVPEILDLVWDRTKGSSWHKKRGWKGDDSTSYCAEKWTGVTCYDVDESDERYGHIEIIDLSDNRLVGSLPAEIFNIPYLSQLILRDNPDLEVSFEGIEKATSLTHLILTKTQIGSFDGVENASDTLEEIHITGCGYEGPFPLQLTKLSNLKGLYANYNNINGEIPSDISNMKELRSLYLYQNAITGFIPLELGFLLNLEELVLSDNWISGEIPYVMNNLSKLRLLAMSDNQLRGSLSSFDNLRSITELYLQNNYFEGSLPQDFLFNGPKHDQIFVDLTNNNLSGIFTGARLREFDFLTINLSGNRFESIDQDFCMKDGWMGGNVDLYGCDAIMCPVGYYSPSGKQTSDDDVCRVCDSSTLGLKYMGAIDCGNEQKTILKGIYEAMDGDNWESNNWYEEEDECLWTGIGCDDNGSVTDINLSGMGLTGTPPWEIFMLPQLQSLNLSQNFIKFQFEGISAAKKLIKLDLSNTGLNSLEDIEQLTATSIRHLHLTSNKLFGEIPEVIWELTQLRDLAISHNYFSGNLSEKIGNLEHLKVFHAYGNKLSGEIPRTIGNLQNTLKELVLSENLFIGEIPDVMSSMQALEIFFMNQITNPDGGLTGPLPDFANCSALKSLNLSGNSISGELPQYFLENSNYLDSDYIEVDLSSNYLEGQIPKSWEKFSFLNIDLSNNLIEHVPSSLCGMDDWQNGYLGESHNDCNFILCDLYTYNSQGRATEGVPCMPCDSAEYLGATYCENENTDNLAILEELYASTNGGNWKSSLGWFTSNNVCDGWIGITCDDDGIDIVKIDLSDNGLSGTPSTSIFKLPKLQELSFEKNQIDFSFDGIAAARNLELLYLSETRISSLDGISKARSLKYLHLTECYLSGPLPSEVFSLSNLEGLYMNYNKFTGRIPSRIGQLSKLQHLYLMSNQLNGPIPAAIGLLSQLKILTLTDNTFSGSLPAELNNLNKIEILSIEHERRNKSPRQKKTQQGFGLTGKLPTFDGLENIKELLLGYNSFTGTIPYNFLQGRSDKSLPLTIGLEYNLLEGDIPSSLTQFSDVETFFQGNKFSGIAPGLCQMSKWNDGDVRENQCNSILCPQNTFSSIGRQSSEESCEPCPQFTASLYLGAVECITDDRMNEKREREILQSLYEKLFGTGWNTQDNWYDEDVSFCSWFGITCAPGDFDSVEAIRLPYNGLVGEVPPEVFGLTNLKELNFDGNKVWMNFDGIENATKLKTLSLDETSIEDLIGIESSPSLEILHLASNNFSNFPTQILQLKNLRVLYLSHNKFNTNLPDMSSLTKLAYFQCHRCALTGNLPDWLGQMKNLQYLSLPGNVFIGSIPSNLGNIKTLEHLNLSEQTPRGGGLTGELPSFNSLENLSELYLNRNRLSGEIQPDFLQNNKATSISVDLRYNELTGAIPVGLEERLHDFTLLLAENNITSIPQTCDLDWNKGDLRKFGCDALMCPPGYYSPIGRQTSGTMFDCKKCESDETDTFYGHTTCGTIPDKIALEAIYNFLGGADWVNNELWMENDLICYWYGVTCDDDQRVIGLDFENNGLVGSVPPEIFSLTQLREINLKKNKISGSFSGINQLKNLHSLNLSETGINSLSGINEASTLRYLHSTGNALTSIPEDIYDLVNLEELYLNYNKMEGTISSKIGQLTSLRELYMFRNKLTGSLPAEIGQLQELRTLGLGENSFSGKLPSELNNLTKIRTIALQHFQMSPTGPGGPLNLKSNKVQGLTGQLPPFDNAPRLTEIYLGYNSISGKIPDNFLENADTNAHIAIDLSRNKISGSLPKPLQRFSYMTIYLSGNQIDSIDNSFCSLGTWMDGEVEKRGCSAIMCPKGTYNQYGRETTEHCMDCAFTFSAPYYGSGECVADLTNYNEKEILMKLFDATGGTDWIDADNWNKEDVSVCKWRGIFCEEVTGGEEVVKEINLPSNKLMGTIPPQVFGLKHLEVLNIRDNKVDVQLSSLMNGNFGLKQLYIDNTLISSLSGIGRLNNLETIHAQKNNFMGKPLPDEIFTLTKLRLLYISDANIGGELSPKIGQLSELEELFCHNNDISGEIPSEIGSLDNLETLILSENRFIGPLPDMSGMKSLQSLLIDSFTRNGAGLSGPLPSFEGMPSLREIYLNENSFTGTISDRFLHDVDDRSDDIKVGLKGNRIEGEVPQSLRHFNKLDIDLAENLISSIHPDLCEKTSWMGGYVEKFRCDAILCPVGYFNQYGRQENPLLPCMKCVGDEQSSHLGATHCQAEVKHKEREILENFYISCGGNKWKNKENWLRQDVDVCHWYGIQCNDEGSVDSILLGANNLVGKIPRELFGLKNLKWLWLYSNPIDFSFHGIDEASSLTSLLLDSTGLTSLDGVGMAYQLIDLEVRFNRLSGPIPNELTRLINLETLSMSDNDFTGTIPSFSRLKRLKSLRISKNKLSGILPSFASNSKLRTIDLSDNGIGGSIPTNFLATLSEDETVFVDLSKNHIEGEVPQNLQRFEKMTIYLKDNFITDLYEDLCDMPLWNDGEVGKYKCSAILCPPGTYAPIRGRKSQSSDCLPCDKAKFYGQSECVILKSSASSRTMACGFLAITLSVTISMLL